LEIRGKLRVSGSPDDFSCAWHSACLSPRERDAAGFGPSKIFFFGWTGRSVV
jgi:hypothetical protein